MLENATTLDLLLDILSYCRTFKNVGKSSLLLYPVQNEGYKYNTSELYIFRVSLELLFNPCKPQVGYDYRIHENNLFITMHILISFLVRVFMLIFVYEIKSYRKRAFRKFFDVI